MIRSTSADQETVSREILEAIDVPIWLYAAVGLLTAIATVLLEQTANVGTLEQWLTGRFFLEILPLLSLCLGDIVVGRRVAKVLRKH